MRIVFKEGTGVTVDNVPSEILAICKSYFSVGRDFILETNVEPIVLTDMLRNAGFINLEIFYDNINVYPTVQVTELADGLLVAVPTTDYALQATRAPVATPAAQAAITACAATPVEFDEDDFEEESEDDDVLEEFRPPMPEMYDITKEELLRRLPVLVPPENASSIKFCTDKIREFDKIWGQAITLKRQIESMMKEIDEGEIAKKINDDIGFLTEKCECVDSVKIGADGELFIITKEIVTANQLKYGSRLLGKMRITIDLKYVYPKNPPNTNYSKAIKIHNLDRNPVGNGVYWSCGHVMNGVDGMQSICWGGYFQQLFDAFVEKDVPRLFDVVMRFITNPNEPDDWGRRVVLFPEVNANET